MIILLYPSFDSCVYISTGPQSSLVTTTATAAVGGKRRLDFDDTSRAFCSKTFFLDLPGHKNVHQLERELVQRGGKVGMTHTVVINEHVCSDYPRKYHVPR